MTYRMHLGLGLAALLGAACGGSEGAKSSSDGGSGGGGGAGGVQCADTAEAMFPAFDKTCTTDADCQVRFHQVSCCGTRAAIGVSNSAGAAFDAAEKICEMQYPGCGCPQGPTTAEDGKTATIGGDSSIQVACTKGACMTFVP